MRGKEESRGAGRLRARHLLALAFAAVLGLGVAVPAFAFEATAESTSSTDGPRVIGGKPVDNGEYKFLTALLARNRPGSDFQKQFCGGTLIDPNSVLTAAHCVAGTRSAKLLVVVGRTVLTSDQGEKRKVVAIRRHPEYDSQKSYRYDAAVLQLANPVSGITPIKLPGRNRNIYETPGRYLTVAGWGNTTKQSPNGNEPDTFPDRMREAGVPVVSDDQAKKVYGSGFAPSLMVAAGRTGRDTCQGDSGGPLFEQTRTGTYQVGITSFGAGCGAKGYPGVYAEVNAGPIRDFITAQAGANN